MTDMRITSSEPGAGRLRKLAAHEIGGMADVR